MIKAKGANGLKLLYVVSEDSYFCSHRLNLAKAAQNAGFEVAVASRYHNHLEPIKSAGIKTYPLKYLRRATANPLQQPLAFLELLRIYRDFKPDLVHHVALKPVILGTCVAHLQKIPKIINALGGLGYVFTGQKTFKKNLLITLIQTLFRWLFNQKSVTVILQNTEDLNTLKKLGCLENVNTQMIRGSGIDTKVFFPVPPPDEKKIKIVCISRMLWDKGIGELVKAAQILKARQIPFEMLLWGDPDPENPACIDKTQLLKWQEEGVVQWKGFCEDVALAYAECNIAVLPSYREGLPKSLLEAAAAGRPIVTTDVPGCREVIHYCKNGILVPLQNAEALAEALQKLCEDKALREALGERGRQNIQRFFSEELIHEQMLNLYREPVF